MPGVKLLSLKRKPHRDDVCRQNAYLATPADCAQYYTCQNILPDENLRTQLLV